MTVWLTRIHMDSRNRFAQRDLVDITRLHQRVMSTVPDGLGEQARQLSGLLFRVDDTRLGAQLLIQSELEPDFSKIPSGYGSAEIRDITPLLRALDKGTAVRYRITGNPVKRLGRNAETPGKIVALRGAAAEQWWIRRAEQNGFALQSLTATNLADAIGRSKDAGRIKHAVTRFDGVAVITDPEAARHAIRAGIGRGKAYGCGLLSLALLR